MIKATIYSVFAICFLAITLSMIIGGFDHPGFNPWVMIAISSVMTLIMLYASWVLWSSRTDSEAHATPSKKTNNKPVHIIKVVFASYGVALAITILAIVAGLGLFGFQSTERVLLDNIGVVLLSIMAISAPFVYRYLR